MKTQFRLRELTRLTLAPNTGTAFVHGESAQSAERGGVLRVTGNLERSDAVMYGVMQHGSFRAGDEIVGQTSGARAVVAGNPQLCGAIVLPN